MADVFDRLPASPTTSAPPTGGGGDVFDRLPSSTATVQVDAPQSIQAPQPIQPQSTGDVFDRLPSPHTEAPQGESADRFGEGDTWLTRPLSTRVGIPEYREGAGGIERGIEKFASGLTSPLNLALAIATGGVGGIAEAGAADVAGVAAEGMAGKFGAAVLSKFGPEMAATIAKSANTISRLTAAGFGLQMLSGFKDQAPEFTDAIKTGDYDKAAELGTNMLLEGAGAIMSGRHAALGATPSNVIGADKYATDAEQKHVRIGGQQSIDFIKQHADLLKDRPTDIAAKLYHAAGGDASYLEAQRKALAYNKYLTPQDKNFLNTALDVAQKLPDSYKAVSDAVRPEYLKNKSELVDMGVLSDDENAQFNENYSGQDKYNMDDEAGSTVKLSGRRQPGFTKYRDFKDVFEAIREGYVPNSGLVSARAEYLREMGGIRGRYFAKQELLKGIDPRTGKPVAAFSTPVNDGHDHIKPGVRLGADVEVSKLQDLIKQNEPTPDMDDPQLPDAESTPSRVVHEERASGEVVAKYQQAAAKLPAALKELDRLKELHQLHDQLDDKIRSDRSATGLERLAQYARTTQAGQDYIDQLMIVDKLQRLAKQRPEIASLRQLPSGEHILYLSEAAADRVSHITWPGKNLKINGVNVGDIEALKRGLSQDLSDPVNNGIYQTLQHYKGEPSGLSMVTRTGYGVKAAVTTAREELSHGWQRELGSGSAYQHLDQARMNRLHGWIPEAMMNYLKGAGYDTSNKQEAVVEASAKMMSGKQVPGMSSEQVASFLHNYFREIQEQYGEQALDKVKHAVGLAERVRKAYTESPTHLTAPEMLAKTGVTSEGQQRSWTRVSTSTADRGAVSDVAEGRTGGTTASADTAHRGTRLKGTGLLVDEKGNLYHDLSDYKAGPDIFKTSRLVALNFDGTPRYEKVPLLIHPDYHENVMRSFQDASWIKSKPMLRALLTGTTQAKKSLLSFSPFHWTTEYLRGIQMGLNPLEAANPPEITASSRAVTANFGPTLGEDASARALMGEGSAANAAWLHKLPLGIGEGLKKVEDKLFGSYIPRLKALSWERTVDQLAKRHTAWSQDQVHLTASRMVDAAYGGLNWRQLGTDMTTQDALRLAMLAPDFTGSQVLFAQAAYKPGGSIARASFARMALYNFAVARVLNMIHTGDTHVEHPFGVVSDDGQKVWSVRTMPEDIAHALTDPRGFIYNRLSPPAKTGIEWITGRDAQGKAVTATKQLQDALKSVLPIPSQNLVPWLRREGETYTTSIARSLGATPTPNRSAADMKAGELASNRSESGPVAPEQLEKHQTMIQLEDAVRTGAGSFNDIYKAYEHGTISLKDAKAIEKNVKETQGMDTQTAHMYTRAARLPMKDFLQVWNIATQPEKLALERVFMTKRQNYFKQAQQMSPAEKANDPVYKQLREMHPNLSPW